MEVHHHAHTSRKKWTHYFWEFIMLFLAVFCGFFAEYQLEHKIERERVKKYMHDMVENLKYDTTRVSLNVAENRNIHNDLDSFRFQIRQAINGRPDNSRLYYYYSRINQFGSAAFNRSAITQLKNSGSLRLIKNDSLLNDILDYYERKVFGSDEYKLETAKALEVLNASSIGLFSTQSLDFVSSRVDSTWNDKITEDDNAGFSALLQDSSLKLLSTDPKELEILHTAAYRFEWTLLYYNRFLNYARKSAEKLMEHIREVY